MRAGGIRAVVQSPEWRRIRVIMLTTFLEIAGYSLLIPVMPSRGGEQRSAFEVALSWF